MPLQGGASSLTQAVAGKESVMLGLRLPGDDSEGDGAWEVAPERVRLARLMHPKLCGRYAKVLRAGVPPPAFSMMRRTAMRAVTAGTAPL